MKIAIGNDHAGTEYKKEIAKYLETKGHQVINCGTDTNDSVDYAVYGKRVADKIVNKEADFGVLICGTGIGISLAANKVKGIRAAVCSECESARLTREHNDANIISFGARIVTIDKAKEIVDTFINTSFSNGERHKKRIQMIADIENGKSIE